MEMEKDVIAMSVTAKLVVESLLICKAKIPYFGLATAVRSIICLGLWLPAVNPQDQSYWSLHW